MKKIKKIKHRVAALAISFFLTLGLAAPAFNITVKAEALQVANSACTIADMIFSYCASGGVAVMNQSVINDVYEVLGSSFGTLQTFVDNGLLTYSDGSYVDTGLAVNIDSALQNFNSIDIDALFNQTAQQNPTGVALTGSATLSGIAGSVATTGVLPIAVGVSVSGFCGFQIGTIIANMLGLYGDNAGKGFTINTSENIIAMIPPGVSNLIVDKNTGTINLYSGDVITVAYNSNGVTFFGVVNPNSTERNVIFLTYRRDGSIVQNENSSLNSWGESLRSVPTSYINSISSSYVFNSVQDYRTALADWKNGGNYKKGNVSPDLIGNDGNISGQYNSDNHKYQFPDVLPQADPSAQSINPSGLSLNDWLRFANSAKGNTGASQPELNTDIFNDIIDAIKINTPTPGYTPETDPETNPVPTPTPNPDPDYDVDQPDTNAPESETPETDPELNPPDFVLPNLMDKFPFCIPNDIATIFGKFRNENRQAPYISWRFNPPGTPIDYTFNLNLSEFEEIAALLRTLELIAFVVGLAYATRYLIGSS